MPINWTDNKVLNTNAQQRSMYNTRPPMPVTPPRTDDMQMQNPRTTAQGDMMNEMMMNDNMRMDNMRMNENIGMNETPNTPMFQEGPPPVMDPHYLAGYLLKNIGKSIRAEFPLPGGFYIDKAGILREVGVNYFVLEDYISHAKIVCDLYSVKFLTIL